MALSLAYQKNKMFDGARVRYMPHHSNGRIDHIDCECGKIVSWSHEQGLVFVIFDGELSAKSVDPKQLFLIEDS